MLQLEESNCFYSIFSPGIIEVNQEVKRCDRRTKKTFAFRFPVAKIIYASVVSVSLLMFPYKEDTLDPWMFYSVHSRDGEL